MPASLKTRACQKNTTCTLPTRTPLTPSSSAKRICLGIDNFRRTGRRPTGSTGREWSERSTRKLTIERESRVGVFECHGWPTTDRCAAEKTSLIGRVKTEVNCIPVENDAYKKWDAARTEMTLRPKPKTQLLDDVPPAGSVLNPAAGNFSNFIVRLMDFQPSLRPLIRCRIRLDLGASRN